MPSPRRRFAALALPALALVLVACGADTTDPGAGPGPTPGPSPDPITAADAAFVGNVVVPALYGSLGGVIGPQVIPDDALEPLAADGCPSFEPDPPPDTDGDGVPDGTTFSFDAEDCDTAGETRTTDWHGAVRVTDPGPARGYDLDFLGLGVTITDLTDGRTVQTRLAGTRSARGTASAVALTEALDFRNVVNLAPTFRSRTGWELDFTATVPGSITGDVLPAGTAEVGGSFLVDDGTRQFALVVETLEPLTYAPACTSFTAGAIRVSAAGREDGGTVRVTFNACGVAPTIAFVDGPA